MKGVTLSSSAVLACCALMSGSAAQQAPRFRSGADAVQVDVQVKVKGRPVRGLTAADFELTDSGVRQQVKVVTYEDVPVSLMLVLDVSASVRGRALDDLKAAAHTAVSALRPIDQAALLSFSQRVTVVSPWTTDRSAIARAIDSLAAKGRTSLYDAVFTAVGLRDGATGRVATLVFTDGTDTASWLDAPAVVRSAADGDLVVYAVSSESGLVAFSPARTLRLGPGTPQVLSTSLFQWFDLEPALFPYAFLEKLTDVTGGETIYVRSGRDLGNAFTGIVGDLKARYLLTYAPVDVPAPGWHPIEVKLKGKAGEVRARRGYSR
jgi:VWFA-related protein